MNNLSVKFLAAGMVFFSAAALAEDAPVLEFENTDPMRSFNIMNMGMKSYAFGEQNENNIITLHGGMYDKVVGVSCEWTLRGPSAKGMTFEYADVVHHSCVQGAEPKKWSGHASIELSSVINHVEKNVIKSRLGTSVSEVLRSFSGNETGKVSMAVATREWNMLSNQVCLQIAFGDLNVPSKNSVPAPTKISASPDVDMNESEPVFKVKAKISNGCYHLSDKEFEEKAKLALSLKAGP